MFTIGVIIIMSQKSIRKYGSQTKNQNQGSRHIYYCNIKYKEGWNKVNYKYPPKKVKENTSLLIYLLLKVFELSPFLERIGSRDYNFSA